MTAGKGRWVFLDGTVVAYGHVHAGSPGTASADHHRHTFSFPIPKRRRLSAFIIATVLLSSVLVGISFACCKEASIDWSIINDSGSDLDVKIYIDGDLVSSGDSLNDQYEMHNISEYTDHFNMFSSSDTIRFTVMGTDSDGNSHIAEKTLVLHDGDKVLIHITLY